MLWNRRKLRWKLRDNEVLVVARVPDQGALRKSRREFGEFRFRQRRLCRAEGGAANRILHLDVARQVTILIQFIRERTRIDRGPDPHLVRQRRVPQARDHGDDVSGDARADR